MEQHFVNSAFVSWSSLKWYLGDINFYWNSIPVLWICVDTIPNIFSALMETDSPSQNNGFPHFWNSIIKTIFETHIFQNMVARNMKNSLHSWYTQIIISFLEMKNNNGNGQPITSLFQLTNYIGSYFNCILVLLIHIYSYISSDLSLNHMIICIFLFIFCQI